ncbi:signal peptidase I [Lacinutrix jangbogonensis]|uniref:signal peptidase I n=1 Tax=Lacinutrix jangbogonensis TaxID=1469557 RepID=UPI00053D0EE1|nr:signal peptidase I [Lacinutrix jangbogonensis]
MNGTQWIILFLIIQLIHGLATWKLYIKAGRKAWEAFIPVYNAVMLMKIINRPWWWTILLFLPIVNLIMFPVIWVETARSFGKNSRLDTILAIVTLGFYNFYLNYIANVNYIEDRSLKPRSNAGEWISSILFAVVAATIVHTYLIQPFVIPSSSLEKTLLVGDFLFVSKFHYGARVPMTTVGLPMVHDSIPKTKTKSYLFNDTFEERNTSWKNKLQLPYMRLPGFEKITRNEIVVFNQPADTLLDMNDFNPDRNYYKPIDKKTNLVKRCVGIPGDELEIKGGHVYINGEKNVLPDRARLQFFYNIKTNGDIRQLFSKYEITESSGYETYYIENKYLEDPKISDFINSNNDIDLKIIERDSLKTEVSGRLTQRFFQRLGMSVAKTNYIGNMTEELALKVSKDPSIISVEKVNSETPDSRLFPQDSEYSYTADNFGPIYIPKKGESLDLTIKNFPLYKRVIGEYERNTITSRGNQVLINGEVATSYTFKQDYYWMMGDNRQNSIDSRYWGFVPFDHVVGKPVLVWMSFDTIKKKVRWDRLFTTVHGTGKTTSYLIPVLVLIAGLVVFNRFRKRKKKAQ